MTEVNKPEPQSPFICLHGEGPANQVLFCAGNACWVGKVAGEEYYTCTKHKPMMRVRFGWAFDPHWHLVREGEDF